MRRKSHWGSWSSWGSSLIALSLGFTVIRVLFRFLIDRILLKVLIDTVFFESSEVRSYSFRSAVIGFSLHHCSFSTMLLVFYQIVLLLSKTDVFFAFIITLKKISLTCFNNFTKTDSEKQNEEMHGRILYWKYVINFPIYICHQIPDEFKVQK